jgi:hypothetical protein
VDIAGRWSVERRSGVTHLSTGNEVTFTRDVSSCAYLRPRPTRTARLPGLHRRRAPQRPGCLRNEEPGRRPDRWPIPPRGRVRRHRSTYAVVGYSADLVRSTHGTTLNPLGSGRYEVKFPRRFHESVAGCAYLATVGDPPARSSTTHPASTRAAVRTGARSTSRPRTRAAGSRTESLPPGRRLPVGPQDAGRSSGRTVSDRGRSSPLRSRPPPASTRW